MISPAACRSPCFSSSALLPCCPPCQVLVCESHDVAGGAAHAWTVRQPGGGEGLYHFEAGPSLYSGQGTAVPHECWLVARLTSKQAHKPLQRACMHGVARCSAQSTQHVHSLPPLMPPRHPRLPACLPRRCMPSRHPLPAAPLPPPIPLAADMSGRGREANPLAHVLQALGEPLDLLKYKTWNVLLPEGEFLTEVSRRHRVQSSRAAQGCAAWQAVTEGLRGQGAGASAAGGGVVDRGKPAMCSIPCPAHQQEYREVVQAVTNGVCRQGQGTRGRGAFAARGEPAGATMGVAQPLCEVL